MRIRCHQLETVDEGNPLGRARMDQVREVLALHNVDIFQSSYGVITQLERLLFDSGEPSLEAREIEWCGSPKLCPTAISTRYRVAVRKQNAIARGHDKRHLAPSRS